MLLKGLGGISREPLRLAFVEAFSDYEVQVDMGPEKFEEFLRARSIDLERSLGIFGEAGLLAGFLLLGFRDSGGRRRFYDGGTGLLPPYRGRKLGEELLRAALGGMKEEGVGDFLLEVLEHNEAAIGLYEKLGFRKTRRFRCYQAEREAFIRASVSVSGFEPREEALGAPALPGFELYPPSWQNELESILLAGELHARVGLYSARGLEAYGFIHRKRGNLPQLCLGEGLRDAGSLASLLRALAPLSEADRLSVINVEEGSALGGLLETLGFENYVNQYEMAYREG